MFKKFKKFVASLLLVTLNIFGTPSLAFAQEITDTPIEPTAEVTIAPENTPEPTVAPTEIPVIVTDTPTPEPTAEPTLEPTPIEVTPTDIPTPTEEAPVAQSPPVDTSTPTVEAVQPQKPEETLTAVILENTSASSALDLILDEPVTAPSATLVTDKADYAPTDSVLITGSNFAPGTSYTIYITSETGGYSFSDTVTADDQGNIVYTHQLDGTYRPEYKVEVKQGDTVLASTTFTDDIQASLPFSDTFGTSNSSTVTNWDENNPAEILGSSSGEDRTRDGNSSNKFAKIGKDGWVRRTINATGYESLQLSYYWKGDNDAENNDRGRIEYCLGSTCTTFSNEITNHKLSSDSWSNKETVNLPASLDDQTFRIRFRNNADSGDEYFRLDQVEITGSQISTQKWTICHATSSPTNPYNRIVVSNKSQGGHFDNSGNPTSGHEEDILLEGDVACPVPTPIPPTPTPVHPTNPSLPQSCGLDIAFVIDNSGSISNSELTQMKNAFNGFVTALTGTPTQYSVTRFNTSASVVQAFTSDTAAVQSAINSISTSGGWTNWEDGLKKAQSTLPNRSNPDLVLFASDGDPTTSNGPLSDLQDAVVVADAIKTSGARIVAFGIGNGLNINNLKAISGPTVGTDLSADVITSDFGDLATDLANYASSICGGTISVNKYIDNLQTRGGNNWMFNVSGPDNYSTDLGTDASGQDNTGTIPANSGYAIIEYANQIPSGYSFGSASCYKPNPAGGTTLVGNSFTDQNGNHGIQNITVGNTDVITCDFINNTATGSISGYKIWDKNDNRIYDGDDEYVSNWSVFIDGNDNQSYDSGETIVQTDGSGLYTFSDLSLGSHTFCEIMKPDWVAGSHAATCYSVNLTNQNPNASGYNFYNYKVGYLKISKDLIPDNSVWYDLGYDNTSITANNQDFTSGWITVPVGEHTVWEKEYNGSDLSGFAITYSGNCDNQGFLTINQGESKTCTITNTQFGSIAGQKWHDLDADGIMDQTEPMLNGWTIFIDGNGNKVLDAGEVSTTTATDNQNNQGEYLLENLTPATYSVCEVDQNGWKRTVPASSNCQDAVVTAGQTTYDIRFGNVQYGSVTGMKWHDLNMDGVKDANEPGLQDWQIFLFPDLTSRKITDVKTDANGYYLMENIIPGQYLVCEVGSPSTIQSWIQSYPLTGSKRDEFYCHQINVTAGQEIEDVDFGNYQYNSITVTKYYDRDDDYEMDATGEEVLSGWDLTLRDEAGAVVGSGTTDPNGQVKFENLIPDRYYYLSETQQAGWRLTSINCDDGLADDSTNNRRTTLDAGNNISCTVGNIRNPVKLSAQKVVCDTEADLPDWGGDRSHVINASTAQAWVDQSNGNCRLENQWTFQWAPAGSGSIGDFAVNTSSLGAPWTTFTAGETVEFNDTSSLGGRIEVREIIPENYAPLIGFSGEPGSVGKSVSAEIYCTGDVYNYDNWDWVNNPQYGSHYYCVAFNALAYASITVDKITDPADDPTSFSIYLKQGDTTVKEFNLTGSENPETFDTLIPGTYSITESVPNGWMNNSWACTINGQPVTSNLELVIGAGDEVSCSFTNTKLGTIVSYKYQDTNANHQFDGDATEPRLNGWTISLFDDSWNLLDSMQTGDSTTPNGEVEPGHYQFKYRSPGTYYVCETGKTGWTQTFPITGVQKDGLYCHTVNLSAGQLKYGIPFGNVQLSDIHGYKWNDLNGDGIRNCSTETVLNREFRFEPICNEPLLPGWTIFIDSNKDGLLSEGEKSMVTSDLPDHLGWYWFEDLLPGEYRICEVGQSGWQQTSTPVCHNVILPYSTQFLATVPTTLNYIQEPTPEFNFGNIFVNPRLTISKSNDAVGDKSAGQSVVYTLIIKALDGALKNVKVVDLLPSGIKYRSGSWTSSKAGVAEPAYTTFGTWIIGDMTKDEVVTLTYIGDIDGGTTPGTYKDVAWASGEDTLKNVHLAEAIDPGYLSTNFVGTSVKIVGGNSISGGYQGQSETKVLGASTELPLTGTPTISTLFALFLIIAGFGTVIYSRKTKKHVQ